jgi:hypothetical protein
VNSGVGPNIIEVGSPLGALYGYVFDGVYQLSDFEANGTTLKPGVVAFGSPRPAFSNLRISVVQMASPMVWLMIMTALLSEIPILNILAVLIIPSPIKACR